MMKKDNLFPTTEIGALALPLAPLEEQSTTFEMQKVSNPLMIACAPLLTLVNQLREQDEVRDLCELHQSLSHEVKIFENKAHALKYRTPIILAARYFLCSLLDEIILQTEWGKGSEWQQTNLLKTFQRESWGGERFFVILERIAEDPTPHLDLLELGYLCLSLGYEGKYRKRSNGHQELGQWMDKLYYIIRDERGEFSKRLFIGPIAKSTQKKTIFRLPSLWATLGATVLILMGIYLPYHLHLNKVAMPIRHALGTMTNINEITS